MQNFKENFKEFVFQKFNRTTVLDEAIRYILFPGGKYYRPKIFQALCADLGANKQDDIFWYSCFLELHHNYTLIHDDLPSMDDDDYRRGRETIHKKYTPWLAVLAGDSLLSLSYECLARIENYNLLNFAHWSLGARGLIMGQVFDLDSKEKSFKEVIRVHELKTSRLMQASLMGAVYLSKRAHEFELYKDIFRLGNSIGVYFQIFDDKDDYDNGERSIENVFTKFSIEADKELAKQKKMREKIISKYQLTHLERSLEII